MLERSQVFKLRAVEKDLSQTALVATSWIDHDQFKYSKVCNNSVTRYFSHCKYGCPRVGMSSGKVLPSNTRSSSSFAFGISAVPRASLLEFYQKPGILRICLSMVGLLGRAYTAKKTRQINY